MSWANLYMRAPGLAHADFLREYGIHRWEIPHLDAVEFVELLSGLSAESRFHGFFADDRSAAEGPVPATVPTMTHAARSHSSREEYLAAMRQHRGRVVEVGGDGA